MVRRSLDITEDISKKKKEKKLDEPLCAASFTVGAEEGANQLTTVRESIVADAIGPQRFHDYSLAAKIFHYMELDG